jgi:hypothetical protein
VGGAGPYAIDAVQPEVAGAHSIHGNQPLLARVDLDNAIAPATIASPIHSMKAAASSMGR